MRWQKCQVYSSLDTGKRDRLGNKIIERKELGVIPVRVAPVNLLANPLDGNAFIQADLTLVTVAAPTELSGVQSLVFDDETYRVSQFTDLGRRRVLSCTKEKQSHE